MTTRWTVTLDCADPSRLARFWALALGYADAPPPAGFDSWDTWFTAFGVPEDERGDGAVLHDPDGVLPGMSLLRVPETKDRKNRLHLDLQVSGGRAVDAPLRQQRIRARVDTLLDAGGRLLAEHPGPDGLDHVVMADPEGNEFCVV